MKTKKAVKKLDKVETLLSDIIDQYDPAAEPRLREALTSAKEFVERARKTVNGGTEAKANKKPAAKAGALQNGATGGTRRKPRAAAAGQ